jgi:hypothetical protein
MTLGALIGVGLLVAVLMFLLKPNKAAVKPNKAAVKSSETLPE